MNIFTKYFWLISCLIVFISCREHSIPNDSTPVARANLTLDFQGGFEDTNLKIFFDYSPRYDQQISSNPNTDFADRVNIRTTADSHMVSLNLNDGEVIFDTTLILTDSLILGIINDTLFQELKVQELSTLPDYSVQELYDFQHLEVYYINAEGYSNLMPPNLPDPLSFKVSFEFINIYDKKIISGIYPEDVYVYTVNNDVLLGNIQMYPMPEIYLYPGESDTITFHKIRQDSKIFETPCDDSIYFKINLRDQYYRGVQIRTGSFLYECVH